MKLRIVAAVLPFLLLTAGCGERRPNGHMPTPVEEAPATQLTGKELVSRLQQTFAERPTWTSTSRITVSGVTSTATTVRQVKPYAVAINLKGKLYGGRGRIVAVNGQVYAALPGRTPPRRYAKIDPKDALGQLVTQIIGTADPGKLYWRFNDDTLETTLVQTGEQLDRYKLTIDTAKAAEALGLTQTKGLPDRLEYAVWVTKDGVGRRIVTKLGTQLIDITLAPSTKPVTIRPPA